MLHRHKMSLLSHFCTFALLFLCLASAVLSEVSVFEQLASFVGSLCSLNENGVFGDCCSENNNGADISTLSDASEIPSCFFESTISDNSIITLFVFPPMSFFFHPFFQVIFQTEILHSSEVVSFQVSLFPMNF